MFAYGFWTKNTMNGVIIDDLFTAMQRNDRTGINAYFADTFARVKETIIATQGKGFTKVGSDEIRAAQNEVIPSIPGYAVTEENRNFLENLARQYENGIVTNTLRLQALKQQLDEERLTPEDKTNMERLQELEASLNGDDPTTPEEKAGMQQLHDIREKVNRRKSTPEEETFNETIEYYSTCRSIALFIAGNIDSQLQAPLPRTTSCTIS